MTAHDAEEVLTVMVADLGNHVGTWMPNSFEGNYPVIHIRRVGGAPTSVMDWPILQVAVISQTRAQSQQVSNEVADRVTSSRGTVVAGVLVDLAFENTGPQQVPYIDPDDRMVVRTFQLSWRH